VLGNGGEAISHKAASKAVDAPVVKGIGDCMLYLVDKYGDKGSMYEDYLPVQGADQNPKGFGLTFIDHLTHNLFFGNMQKWSDYYERLFNFREIRYFDIKGAKTGLVSKAMTAPDGIVRIPLNESSDPKSQINEYLDAYKGEGIQHIACFTDNIYDTVEAMRAQGVEFLDTPDTYFDVIDQRVPNHGEDVPRLARNKILIDADPEPSSASCCRSSPRTRSGRSSSRSSSARATKASAKAISRRCSRASSATRCAAACCKPRKSRGRHAIDRLQTGFANEFATEAVAGALPVGRNSPQRVAHGLYAEQGERHRVHGAASRESAQLAVSDATGGDAWRVRGVRASALPQRFRWWSGVAGPVALESAADPSAKTDFIEGLFTMAGNGSAASQHGVGIHLYAANRDMGIASSTTPMRSC
jgi:hypothetical protein